MTGKDQKKEKKDKSHIEEAAKQIMNGPDAPKAEESNAIGVDVGTSKIVFSRKNGALDDFNAQQNAFIEVDYSKFTRDILKQNKINHYKTGNSLVVFGDGAEVFANMLNSETRRTMRNGLMNPNEPNAIEIIKGIINELVPPAKGSNVPLCFSIPGVPKDTETDIIYHEAILKRHLTKRGYKARSINEGLAVVFAELEKENFTGFGISAGGGMCNVCLAYLSVPHISFSTNKAGDYIDDAVASVTSEVNTRVRDFKENKLNLSKSPRNEMEDALHIYYDDLILSLVTAMKESITKTTKIPKADTPIPVVLSGGTAMPNGFKSRFETCLQESNFPLKISEVRVADDPLNATAKGALIAAQYED